MRLHSRQVQHTFRFYSQQWRTWAAIFIQAAWRRYMKKKKLKMEEEEEEEEEGEGPVASIRATFLASKFAANALHKIHQNRIAAKPTKELVKFQKPSEPDFSADDP
ncbi:hypothetical protein YC2023_105963 [Brassica napus]